MADPRLTHEITRLTADYDPASTRLMSITKKRLLALLTGFPSIEWSRGQVTNILILLCNKAPMVGCAYFVFL